MSDWIASSSLILWCKNLISKISDLAMRVAYIIHRVDPLLIKYKTLILVSLTKTFTKELVVLNNSSSEWRIWVGSLAGESPSSLWAVVADDQYHSFIHCPRHNGTITLFGRVLAQTLEVIDEEKEYRLVLKLLVSEESKNIVIFIHKFDRPGPRVYFSFLLSCHFHELIIYSH